MNFYPNNMLDIITILSMLISKIKNDRYKFNKYADEHGNIYANMTTGEIEVEDQYIDNKSNNTTNDELKEDQNTETESNKDKYLVKQNDRMNEINEILKLDDNKILLKYKNYKFSSNQNLKITINEIKNNLTLEKDITMSYLYIYKTIPFLENNDSIENLTVENKNILKKIKNKLNLVSEGIDVLDDIKNYINKNNLLLDSKQIITIIDSLEILLNSMYK